MSKYLIPPEVTELKHEAERKISEAVREFIEKTGLTVKGVEMTVVELNLGHKSLVRLKMNVEIP